MCSLDCVYCEVGKTTNLTTERKEYFPLEEIIAEINNYLSSNPTLDYITFSGYGEPTLYSKIGEIVSFIKMNYPKYKLALITNSTLLADKSLRKEIAGIDLLMPSLDAVSREVFDKINRPVKGLKAEYIINGLIEYRKESTAEIWLEIFIISGINDSLEELKLFKEAIEKIKPNRVQLNSLDRPGTEDWVEAAQKKRLEEIKEFLTNTVPIEIVAKFASGNAKETDNIIEKIKATIKRRPCTLDDICNMLNIKADEVEKHLRALSKDNNIITETLDRGTFYRIK